MLAITIHNDGTGTKDTGNYRCKAYINNDVVCEVTVSDFDRSLGWSELASMVAWQFKVCAQQKRAERLNALLAGG